MRSRMLLPVVALLVGMGGCSRTEYQDTAPLRGGEDTGAPDTDEASAFTLAPDVALAGEVVIVSLRSADLDFDYAGIAELIFYGGEAVTICATRDRGDELLISLGIPDDAVEGPVDLIIRMADGEDHFVKGALTIIGAEPTE